MNLFLIMKVGLRRTVLEIFPGTSVEFSNRCMMKVSRENVVVDSVFLLHNTVFQYENLKTAAILNVD